MSLDPVTLAVLKGRLEQIADEMDATLYRSAFNPIIAEARDACHGLYHRETGDTLVQGTKGLPIFVGAMAFAVKAVIEKVKTQKGIQIEHAVVEGANHFFDGRVEQLMEQVSAYLDRKVGPEILKSEQEKA